MLPTFPEFKTIDIHDRSAVEAHTSKYPPYSDFNFTSMWCWDVKGDMRISQLNGNLVVRFTDYKTGELFYSFLGTSHVSDTAKKLLDLSVKEGLQPILKLLPEVSISEIDQKSFIVEEDRDNFDYVYNIDNLLRYEGHKFETQRNQVNRFLKKYEKVSTCTLNLNEKVFRDKIIELCQQWEENKLMEGKKIKLENEFIALKRLFTEQDHHHFLSVGIFIRDELLGFCINECLSSNNAISHFAKADTRYSGIYDYLMRENSRILLTTGRIFLNYEQDLGLSKLRYAKSAYRPQTFLKKYVVGYTKYHGN